MPRSPHSGGPLGNWGRGPSSGGAVFGRQLDAEVLDLLEEGEVVPSVGVSPGWRAQLSYLLKRKGGADAMDRAGIPARTRRGWKHRTPSKRSQERIRRAYWSLRAVNWRRTGHTPPVAVRKSLVGQLEERAYGKRMTITPVNWREVQAQAQGAQRTAGERELRPSRQSWDRLIGAWAAKDKDALDDAWMDFATEIDSPEELYYEVEHVGFVL